MCIKLFYIRLEHGWYLIPAGNPETNISWIQRDKCNIVSNIFYENDPRNTCIYRKMRIRRCLNNEGTSIAMPYYIIIKLIVPKKHMP